LAFIKGDTIKFEIRFRVSVAKRVHILTRQIGSGHWVHALLHW